MEAYNLLDRVFAFIEELTSANANAYVIPSSEVTAFFGPLKGEYQKALHESNLSTWKLESENIRLQKELIEQEKLGLSKEKQLAEVVSKHGKCLGIIKGLERQIEEVKKDHKRKVQKLVYDLESEEERTKVCKRQLAKAAADAKNFKELFENKTLTAAELRLDLKRAKDVQKRQEKTEVDYYKKKLDHARYDFETSYNLKLKELEKRHQYEIEYTKSQTKREFVQVFHLQSGRSRSRSPKMSKRSDSNSNFGSEKSATTVNSSEIDTKISEIRHRKKIETELERPKVKVEVAETEPPSQSTSEYASCHYFSSLDLDHDEVKEDAAE